MFGISWNWSRRSGGRYGGGRKLSIYTLIVLPPGPRPTGAKYEVEWVGGPTQQTSFRAPVKLVRKESYLSQGLPAFFQVRQKLPGGQWTPVYTAPYPGETPGPEIVLPGKTVHVYVPPWWEGSYKGTYGAQTRGGLSIIPHLRASKWGPWGTG